MFPFAGNIADWLSWVFCRFQAAGVALPGQPTVNFLSPLTAVNNDANTSIDVSMTGSIIAYGGQAATATFAIPANTHVGLNTSANAVAMTTPGTPTPGTVFGVTDVARAVMTNEGTLTDATNNYPIQNPIDFDFYPTITWGPGSGGASNPALPPGFPATWRQMVRTISGTPQTVWAVAR